MAGVPVRNDHTALAALLAGAGFIAPVEEADELLAAAAGDAAVLDTLVERRLTGEPLAWIPRIVLICAIQVRVDPAACVPRCHRVELALRAVERLPGAVPAGDLAHLGYVDVTVLRDEEGDVRGIEAVLGRRLR